MLTELESLIRRINRTNAATLVEGGTLTDALARRDVLRLRHSMVTSAADAAAGEGQRGYRQLRSELKMIAALPVAELRHQADDLARQVREGHADSAGQLGGRFARLTDAEQVADVEACANPRAGG